MKAFPITAIIAGASMLALSHSAVAQPGVLPPERPLAQVGDVRSPPVVQPAPRRAAPSERLARVQAPTPPCSQFGCRRMILLGIAY
jgi:hypothetical protein